MLRFLGDPFWKHSVFSAIWFDSGYMLLPVYVVVGTVSVHSAMLVPQWYMLCVSHGVSCWLRCTSRCVPLWFSDPDALHHGRVGPEGQLQWLRSYISSWSSSSLS